MGNTAVTYYKVLGQGRKAIHGGTYTYPVGNWTPRVTDPEPCVCGYHVTDADNLASWLYASDDEELPLEVWECEAEGMVPDEGKWACERVKLVRLMGTLDEYDLRWLGSIFAERVVENANDQHVIDCINTVRAYCVGAATAGELSAAWNTAWDVARSAPYSAARRAAESAASGATEDAARSVAWAAARRAAESAAQNAARRAAESAASGAAENAAWNIAWNIAWDTTWSEQGHIALAYLGGEMTA